MANEVRAQASLQVSSNGFTITGNSTQTLSLTGSQYEGTIVSVGVNYEQLPLGDLSDFRYIFLYNQSTGSVTVASTVGTTTQSFALLQPADVLVFPPSGSAATFHVKSTLSGSDVQFVATET